VSHADTQIPTLGELMLVRTKDYVRHNAIALLALFVALGGT
jgi:hypothetical protein